MNLTIDTFAWIEIVRDTRRGRAARAAIESADRCLTPGVVLAEVAIICKRDGFADQLVSEELAAIGEASRVVQIDSSIVLAAAHALTELRAAARDRKLTLPGLGDALILATARGEGTGVLTGDPHFRSFPETVWIGDGPG